MKYTQGEWSIRDLEIIGPYESNKSICEITGNFMHEDEAMANAKLIAAAPELLNALLFLLQSYRADFKMITGAPLNDTLAVLSAKAAIKKATE